MKLSDSYKKKCVCCCFIVAVMAIVIVIVLVEVVYVAVVADFAVDVVSIADVNLGNVIVVVLLLGLLLQWLFLF